MADGSAPFPGDETEPGALLVLANQYRLAFRNLRAPSAGNPKWLTAPAVLCAIHAIELYLQVVLRCDGISGKKLRATPHKLSVLASHPAIEALNLRAKTREHLQAMTDAREYLLVRYAPEVQENRSQINRIEATLEELATKAGKRFDQINNGR